MRVLYRAHRASATAPVVHQPKGITFCSVEMNHWWGRLIGFGVRDCPASISQDVNLFLDWPQGNGKTVLEVVPVQCCPWCGEAVKCCRVIK